MRLPRGVIRAFLLLCVRCERRASACSMRDDLVEGMQRIERILDAYGAAGRPGPPETFTLYAYDGGRHLRHPQMPAFRFPAP